MRVLKLSIVAVALTVELATPGLAQTPQTLPKPQTPTQTPPAPKPATPAAPQPETLKQPPAPFPQDAKYAVVDVQTIAQSSAAGKAASAKLNDLQAKKASELQDKNKQLQALTTKRDQGGSLLNES